MASTRGPAVPGMGRCRALLTLIAMPYLAAIADLDKKALQETDRDHGTHELPDSAEASSVTLDIPPVFRVGSVAAGNVQAGRTGVSQNTDQALAHVRESGVPTAVPKPLRTSRPTRMFA